MINEYHTWMHLQALQNVLPDARDRSLFLMNLLMTKTAQQQQGPQPINAVLQLLANVW